MVTLCISVCEIPVFTLFAWHVRPAHPRYPTVNKNMFSLTSIIWFVKMTRQMGHKPWTRLRPFISWSSCLSDHLVDSHPTLCSTYTFPKRKDSNGSLKTKTHELIYRISPRGSAVVVLRLVNHFIFNSLEHHFPIVGHALAGYNYTIIITIIHIFIAYSYIIIIIIYIYYVIHVSSFTYPYPRLKLFLRFVAPRLAP